MGNRVEARWQRSLVDSPTASQPSVQIDLPGAYVFELVVNDGVQNSVPDQVTITSLPGITAPAATTVGAGLMVNVGATLDVSAHGGREVTVASNDPAVLVAPEATTPGAASFTRHLNDGQTSIPYYVQGLETHWHGNGDDFGRWLHTGVAYGHCRRGGGGDPQPAVGDRHAVGTWSTPPGMSRSGSAIRRTRPSPSRTAARRPGVRGDAHKQSWHRRTAAIGRTRDHRPGRHEADRRRRLLHNGRYGWDDLRAGVRATGRGATTVSVTGPPGSDDDQ